ncbi:2'-5' RNA ligase family protein [Streptomyces sp. NPDC059786]|uniref:2'-5' RNA ligase family protein n=1 Tax=Streptomyces sp. NPDC059786 TaxID=3346946 RepID=UPI0036633634
MHSVELLPDPATERAVEDVWRRLEESGRPSLATHRHPTNRPHLTLATADALPPETGDRVRCALAVLPLPLCLDGTVRFAGRKPVLAWAVRADDALLRLHETVWRALRDAPGGGRPNPLHDPARWTPHITLGRGRDTVPPGPEPEPDEDPFRGTTTPSGVLTGRWTGARHYDSVTRTTEPIGP